MSDFARAQAGDSQALAHLVRKHIPLVQALCSRFSYCEDAFQQGCMGLVAAIRRFSEERGCLFSTYAVPFILGEMRRSLSHTLGWRARKTLKGAREYQQTILKETGKEPTIRETAAACRIAPEELVLLLERDQPYVYDETGALIPSIPDPHSQDWIQKICIRDILQRLPLEDRRLLILRFLQGESQEHLAEKWKISQSTLSRREKNARMRFIEAWNASKFFNKRLTNVKGYDIFIPGLKEPVP